MNRKMKSTSQGEFDGIPSQDHQDVVDDEADVEHEFPMKNHSLKSPCCRYMDVSMTEVNEDGERGSR